MTLREITEKCQGLPINEKRQIDDQVVDVVLLNQDLEVWQQCLQNLLGAPLKPQGENPGKEAKTVTQSFGGIRKEQTLFYLNTDQGEIMAMFWPWQNGQNTTLKIFKLK